jgi:hypothetical protein
MLEYTTISNPRPSFGMLIRHTDSEREYRYDAAPPSTGKLVSALREAPRHGWYVLDMKAEWRCVFPEDVGA